MSLPTEILGNIHSLESLAAVDGPGLRFLVFMQGCPLRCIFCHNPDSWDFSIKHSMSCDEVFKKILRMRPYFGKCGGVTISGGEPTAQPEFVIALLELCKKSHIHTALDTSGAIFTDASQAVMLASDLILLDIKGCNETNFYQTCQGNFDIFMKNLLFLKSNQKEVWIRHVVGKGLNDSQTSLTQLVELCQGLNISRIDLLPYHEMGIPKWEKLGISYLGKEIKVPSVEQINQMKRFLQQAFENKVIIS